MADHTTTKVSVTQTILNDRPEGILGLKFTLHGIAHSQDSITLNAIAPPTQAEIEAFHRIIRLSINDPVDQDRLIADFLAALLPHLNYGPQALYAVN